MKLPHGPLVPAAFLVTVLAASLTVVGAVGVPIATGPNSPLVGPCGGYRTAPKGTYQTLALKMVPSPVTGGDRFDRLTTPERVEAQLARIAEARATYLPTVGDACLAAHVSDWLNYYEREARTAIARNAELNGFASEYEKKLAEEEDQVRALAARLGVKR
ncbi:hypothetical protein [Methylobacterium aquaticum]|nr:hypothetical protein [Methylobacterium aquaticum]